MRGIIVGLTIGGCFFASIGVAGDFSARVQLDDGRVTSSEWKTPSQEIRDLVSPGWGAAKLILSLLSLGCFAGAIVLSYDAERVELAYQEEVNREKQKQIVKAQMEAEREIEAHAVIAEQHGQRYFAEKTGIPIDAFIVEDSPVQPAPQAQAQAQEIAVAEKPVEVAAPNEANGYQILDELVVSSRSTLFAAATGTGKSVSEYYVLNRLFSKYPDGEYYVICQKNDSFLGLRDKNRVRMFDPFNPEHAFEFLDKVYGIYNTRRHALENERSEFKQKPVRLILADWHSIYDSGKRIKVQRPREDDKLMTINWFHAEVLPKLSTLITVGRELNVCLIVDTQSYNVGSLGLAEDSNIRANLNVVCQGYSWKDTEGMVHGDFAMIGNLLSNRYLTPSSMHEALSTRLEELKKQSEATKTPVIFSSVGSPKLALLPDLRAYKPGS